MFQNTFRVSLGDFEYLSTTDQVQATLGTMSLFQNLDHVRLITAVTKTNLDGLINERTMIAAGREESWQRRGIQEEIRHIREVNKETQLQQIRHYLATTEQYIAATDLNSWGILAIEDEPEMPFSGDYAEEIDHLYPIYRYGDKTEFDYSRPYLIAIGSYQLKGSWSLRRPLVDLITQSDSSLAVCVDIKKVRPERIEMIANSMTAMLNEGRRSVKADDVRNLEAATLCLNHESESTHMMRIICVLMGNNLEELRLLRRQLVRKNLPFMRFDSFFSYQSAALGYFMPGKNKSGDLPRGEHPILTSGITSVASMWGFGSERPFEGIYVGKRLSFYGNTGQRGLYYLKGWSGKKANHANIFGKTGSGKSTNVRALLHREAEQGTQIIVLDPQPHVRKFAGLFSEETMDYHSVGVSNLTFNPLDVVWGDFSQQADHVRAILKIMLNPDGDTPKRFTVLEVAAIEAALKITYEDYKWKELLEDQSITPTLDIFVSHLKQEGIHGERLAEEIYTLYVVGDRSRIFNAISSLDTRLKKQVCIYDFSPIFNSSSASGMKGLFYYIVLSAIYREVRINPERRQIIFIDEFGAMMSEQSLVKTLAIMYKTFRTFNAGIWVADQNPFTLAGISSLSGAGSSTKDLDDRLSILRNTPRTFAFALDAGDTEQLREIYPRQILPSHTQFLTSAKPGEAVIRADGEGTEMVYFSLKPSEITHLLGS